MDSHRTFTFAEAKFSIESQLAELGKALDPHQLEIVLCEDNRSVVIYHPDGKGHWVYSGFNFLEINPDDFDASYYVAEFTSPTIFH